MDPLRELVLESASNVNPEKLTSLAVQAANLSLAEVIMPQQNKAPTSVKNLAGIFAGTDGFVKKIEQKVKKKYSALECSDSDGFGGGIQQVPVKQKLSLRFLEVILGKISRIKRVKSAHKRNSAKKKRKLDKRKLILSSDSSSVEVSIAEEVPAVQAIKHLGKFAFPP